MLKWATFSTLNTDPTPPKTKRTKTLKSVKIRVNPWLKLQNEPKVGEASCFAVIHPGPKGRPHSGFWLPTSGSFKKQNEPNFPFFNRKSNLENRKSQNEPKICAICEICGFNICQNMIYRKTL
jgi:hypothetical protein